MEFTPEQLAAFRRFVEVQKGKRYNMITAEARTAARITRDEQLFIVRNYEALKKASEAQNSKP